MTDAADRAQELEDVHRENALIAQRRRAAPSGAGADRCMSCDGVIPQVRRDALPRCGLCVDCQEDVERGMGRC